MLTAGIFPASPLEEDITDVFNSHFSQYWYQGFNYFLFFFINQLIAGPGSFRSESQDQDSSSGAVDRAVSMSVAISLLPRKEKHQPLKRLVWDSLLPWQHEDVAVSEPRSTVKKICTSLCDSMVERLLKEMWVFSAAECRFNCSLSRAAYSQTASKWLANALMEHKSAFTCKTQSETELGLTSVRMLDIWKAARWR